MKQSIGFVILSWNSEKYIKECLDAVFALTHYAAHVVLVDNGSKDGTLQIVESIVVPQDCNLKIIKHTENLGTSVTRNEGIEYLRSINVDYVCILDSDAIINEEAIDKLLLALESDKTYGIVGPKLVSSDGTVQLSGRVFPSLFEKLLKTLPIAALQKKGEAMEMIVPVYDSLGAYPVDYLMSACWLMKPEVFNETGLFDENFFYAPEDAEYCIRVWKSGYKVVHQPNAAVLHYWQRISKDKMLSSINAKHIKGLLYMFRKHHYCFSVSRIRKQFR